MPHPQRGARRSSKPASSLRVRPLAGISIAVLTLAACGTAAAPSSGTAAAPSSGTAAAPSSGTVARIKKAGVLRAGMTPNLPGISVKGLSGKWQGFSIKLTDLLAKQMGVKVDYVTTTADNRIPFLTQNKVDVMSTIFNIDPARKKSVAFAGPYYLSYDGILVKKGNPEHIASVADLNGKKVCAIQGSDGPVVLKKQAPNAQIVTFDLLSKCVLALTNGSVDAVTSAQSQVGGFILNTPGLQLLKIKLNKNDPALWGIGVPKSEIGFCRYINSFIKDSIANGSLLRAWNSTIGKVGVPGPRTLPPNQNNCT